MEVGCSQGWTRLVACNLPTTLYWAAEANVIMERQLEHGVDTVKEQQLKQANLLVDHDNISLVEALILLLSVSWIAI